VIALLNHNAWEPFVTEWRSNRIAKELSNKYGLVIRYSNPKDFFVPPDQPLSNNPAKGFLIEQAEMPYILTALKGIRTALSKYPKSLVQRFLKAVFIAGVIKSYDVEIGGSYYNSWIYLSAKQKYESSGAGLYALNTHHELSSLFLNGADFPASKWKSVNAPSFKYLANPVDVVHAASLNSRQNPENTDFWYKGGFVDDYGMSSLNNDFNMYAELAMSDPQKLKQLARKYPRIKSKTKIFVEFYTSLDPELGDYLKSVGLSMDLALK
jgi:hypothetical protein